MPAVVIVQLLLTAAACLGLWRLCRAQPKIVIAGFLVRALAGQALFWISYLRLPFARSLQLGNGFWFFAVDGPFYLGYATDLAARGPAAILLDAHYPSQFFVQVLSLGAGALGGVASIAILLNCAAYLATCTIITRIARPRNNVVLAAIACSPAAILFSLQPLKDTLFTLLIVAMIAAFRRWEESWRAGGRWARFTGYALAMCAVIFAIAGIRWYVSVIAWGAAAIFFVLTALQARRKGWAFATGALLVILLAQSIRLGAHDLQPAYDRLLNPMTALQWRPSATKKHLTEVRKGFESTPGATTIAEGGALAQPDPVATPTTTIAEVAPPQPDPVAEPTTTVAEVAPPQPDPVAAPTTTIAEVAPPQPDPVAAPTTTIAEVAPPQPDPVAAPTTTIVEVARPQPPEIVPAIAPVVPPAPQTPGEEPPSLFPSRFASRVISGCAAMFLPRFLGESLGLVRVGGGRGLWLFAEVDTLIFDLVLLYALIHSARNLRRGRKKMTATFVFCVLVFVMTAGPMLYTVNNFGTLFRLRLMVYCIAAVLPITLREEGDALQ